MYIRLCRGTLSLKGELGMRMCNAVIALAALLLITALPCPAQTTYGRILGNARDASDSVVPAVKVTVVNEATRESYTQLTNELGAYAFNTLIPGTYTIQTEVTRLRPIQI